MAKASKTKKKVKAKAQTKTKAKKKAGKKPAKKPVKKAAKKKAAAKTAKPAKKSSAKPAAAQKVKQTDKKATSAAVSEIANAFTPLDDRVLIRREGVSQMTPGGIYIPDMVAASERPNRGTVLAVGRGHRDKKGRLRPLDVKKGDEVMFNSYAGSEVNIGGLDYLILREDDIIAVAKS